MKRNSFILWAAVLVLLAAGIVFAYERCRISAQPVSPTPVVTETPVPSSSSANTLSMKVGQKAQFGNATLTLHAITEDSRCPANVNCIWAGRVSAEFDAVSGKLSQRIIIRTDSATAFGGYDFKIESVKPQKTKTQNIPSDYTLVISYISNN